MRRLYFAALVCLAAALPLPAQRVPGRDLLTYPLGLIAEAPVLATQGETGLWNPAGAALGDSVRVRVAAATMNAPVDVAITAQLVGLAWRPWRGTTLHGSLVRASVGGLVRTESDPQSIGGDIPYETTLLSLGAAHRMGRHLVLGGALRRRSGRLDDARAAAWSVDGGVLAQGLLGRRDVRLGAGTFLARPLGGDAERSALSAAGDLRLAGPDSLRQARGGVSVLWTDGLGRETFLFGSLRWMRVEARGGLVRTQAFGGANSRLRVGAALRHAGYAIGVAREDGEGALAPTWQFTLSSLFK